MRRRTLLGSAGLLLAAPAIRARAQAAGELVIGFAMAKTGPYVSLANTNEVAVDLAVAEINAAGGIGGRRLRVEKFDTGGDPRQASLAVQKLAEDNRALAIIGPFSSSEVRVSFPVGERIGVVQMSMSSSAPGLAKPYKFAFRNTLDEGKVIGEVLAALVGRNLPHAAAAIAYATDDTVSKSVGTAVLPALFRERQVAVKGSVDFQYRAFDLSPQVSQLAQMRPDIIGVGAPPEAMVALAKELKRQGVGGRMIAGTTVADPDLPQRMGEGGNGALVGTTFFEGLNDRTRAFGARFAEAARQAGIARTQPNGQDASSYDIVLLFAEAMRRGGVTGDPAKLAQERTAIRDQLLALREFPSLEGPLSFGQDHDAVKPIYVVEASDGAWKLFETRHG
ncbi:ABC transporter substrate-binding protein [Roseomonas sp. NAR14]|uniref:ABC transporter substrate-binding protein n=1 Tax=Roseomonas acroporae TaxID=2937791 RepID=A0A9X2BTK7_9PROT|nr:ABC transporter substrate-binding protein [Roseomonas acroporae]MCK8784422.1 ABC transporter substrate-binding protein [Roseomonas acroporae]